MLPEERRRKLLDHIRTNGSMNVAELSERLRVSAATIRRDLQELQARGTVQRTHGGAVPPAPSSAYEPLHEHKQHVNEAEKRAIGLYASGFVDDGDVIVLDSGSTTLALAQHLGDKRGVTVITTDLKIAVQASDDPAVEVIITGGRVRPRLYSIIGPAAEATLEGFHARTVFLGADAIDADAGVTNANLDEVAVKRKVLACGQRKILLADHTKFGKTSLAKVCDLDLFDHIITDAGLSEEVAAQYERVAGAFARAPLGAGWEPAC